MKSGLNFQLLLNSIIYLKGEHIIQEIKTNVSIQPKSCYIQYKLSVFVDGKRKSLLKYHIDKQHLLTSINAIRHRYINYVIK